MHMKLSALCNDASGIQSRSPPRSRPLASKTSVSFVCFYCGIFLAFLLEHWKAGILHYQAWTNKRHSGLTEDKSRQTTKSEIWKMTENFLKGWWKMCRVKQKRRDEWMSQNAIISVVWMDLNAASQNSGRSIKLATPWPHLVLRVYKNAQLPISSRLHVS